MDLRCSPPGNEINFALIHNIVLESGGNLAAKITTPHRLRRKPIPFLFQSCSAAFLISSGRTWVSTYSIYFNNRRYRLNLYKDAPTLFRSILGSPDFLHFAGNHINYPLANIGGPVGGALDIVRHPYQARSPVDRLGVRHHKREQFAEDLVIYTVYHFVHTNYLDRPL